jgi:hypothetical protein
MREFAYPPLPFVILTVPLSPLPREQAPPFKTITIRWPEPFTGAVAVAEQDSNPLHVDPQFVTDAVSVLPALKIGLLDTTVIVDPLERAPEGEVVIVKSM